MTKRRNEVTGTRVSRIAGEILAMRTWMDFIFSDLGLPDLKALAASALTQHETPFDSPRLVSAPKPKRKKPNGRVKVSAFRYRRRSSLKGK